MGRAVASMVARSRKSVKDVCLLKALQLEISHEKSSDQPQYPLHIGSIGDFQFSWDAPYSQHTVLHKKSHSGEEVAVSALLGPESTNTSFPWDLTIKVCVKKPALTSVLQFDCRVSTYKNASGSDFNIYRAYFLPSLAPPTLSLYRGPQFSTLDPSLQEELKRYLESKGIGASLTNFLLLHMHNKEQQQYLTWLEKLKDMHRQVA